MTTVMASGCFDSLHSGHGWFLGYCAAQGDELLVGINSDRYMIEVKHTNPMQSQSIRRQALLNFGLKDVFIFDEPNLVPYIKSRMPNVYCVGEEYRGRCAEVDYCQQYGIKVVFVPRVGSWSSTATRQAI